MKSKYLMFPILGLAALCAGAQTAPATSAPPAAGSKVAVIDIQAAILQTKDGQKAAANLQTKFSPKKAELDRKQGEIAASQEQYRKGANAMNEDAKQKLVRDIDMKTKSLNRDTDDANAELEQENQRLMSDLGGKMMAVLNKYATDNGYVLVLDVSSQQTPVLYASNTIDITREIIGLYDKGSASMTTPMSSAPRLGTPAPASPARGTGSVPSTVRRTPSPAPAAAPKTTP
ncbi:MAG: OmpH family outer membrane protein [Bryobacteraceae bacterium]